MAPGLQRGFVDFALAEAAQEVMVGALAAARMTIRYILRTQDGREFPTQAVIVMVPGGRVQYPIGFSGPSLRVALSGGHRQAAVVPLLLCPPGGLP